jgi:putative transcriptional regulator
VDQRHLHAPEWPLSDNLGAAGAPGREVFMIVRKTLKQAMAEGGYIDREKFDSFTDADIERMIDENPDLAPRTETLPPYFEAREVRLKLGLSKQKFAKKIGLPLAAVREWERTGTPTDPALQALLRILDRIPEPALRALDEPVWQAG